MAIYPISPGSPDYSSNGTVQFIPEVFSGKTQVKFYEEARVAAVCNTDYEGEIKNKGDKVIIRTVSDITGGDYSKDQDIVFQTPESDSLELLINKGKYFAFRCDDVNLKQVDINLFEKWQEDGSHQTTKLIDKDVFQSVYADVPAANQGLTAGADSGSFVLGTTGAPCSITKANIVDYIVDMGTVLDEQGVLETRTWWILIPPWMRGMIKKSDLQDASITGDDKSILRNNGRIGMIDRFEIYNSKQLLTGGSGADKYWYCLFGSKDAISFASQLTETKTVDFEKSFGQGIKGLTIYGYKVVKPEALGLFIAKK